MTRYANQFGRAMAPWAPWLHLLYDSDQCFATCGLRKSYKSIIIDWSQPGIFEIEYVLQVGPFNQTSTGM